MDTLIKYLITIFISFEIIVFVITRIVKGSAAIFISVILSIIFTVFFVKFLDKIKNSRPLIKKDDLKLPQIDDGELDHILIDSLNKINEVLEFQQGSGLEIDGLSKGLHNLLYRQIDLCERIFTYRKAIIRFDIDEKDMKLQEFFLLIENETDNNVIEDYRKTVNSIEESISEYYEICKLEKTLDSKINRISNFLISVELKLFKLKDAYKTVSTTDLKNEMEDIRKEIDSFSEGINELNF